MKVSDVLPAGKKNARTGKDIALYLGCDIRQLTQQIERERRQGSPICATSNSENPGYYMAADAEELQQYCDRLQGRAIELFKTRKALVATLKKITEAMQTGE